MLTAPKRLVAHHAPAIVATDFAELRAREFARLDAQDHAYLDYTGSALYPESLVREHAAMLGGAILGNPHAESSASLASTAWIVEARARVLRFLDADPAEYGVCFTGNATGAIAHVAQGFRFERSAPLVLTADNHNSVNGIREYAQRAGVTTHYLPLDAELRLASAERKLAEERGKGAQLFALPAQSNFSGVRHPLTLVRTARELGYTVLLDAASYLPTSRLSLREVPAEFVALSFYKIFGYPTGLGALVARHEALARLERPWFSGGTVDYVSVQNGVHALRPGVEAFEDGTANFLGIAAVPAGLDFIESLGGTCVERHVRELTQLMLRELSALRHRNGAPLVRIYGPRTMDARGGTVAFNVMNDAREAIHYSVVEQRARTSRVSVRGGCFCNPGAAESAFGFPAGQALRCLRSNGDEPWSMKRFAECMRGHAVGAIRASVGVASNARDVERLIAVVRTFRT